jgi:hypothetical protein
MNITPANIDHLDTPNAYAVCAAETLALTNAIKPALWTHSRQQAQNWGGVGDLTEVGNLLRQALQILTGGEAE